MLISPMGRKASILPLRRGLDKRNGKRACRLREFFRRRLVCHY